MTMRSCAGAGDGRDEVHHVDLAERRLVVPRLLDGRRCPTAASWSLMYLRVCSIAGEPAGRGPMRDELAQVLPRAARVELRRAASARTARATTTISAEIAQQIAEQSSPIVRDLMR